MAMRRMNHAAGSMDQLFATTKGDRTISNLLPVLGPPQRPLDFNVEDGLSHERWPVEKLFEGKQIYLENSLSTMVKRTHNPFVTNLILPLRYRHGITFVWSKWHGNRTLARQTPVGSPPERVTQQRTHFRTTMNRYELGFVVNAETLDNPEGEFALALDLATVGVAFGDTFEQLGLAALTQTKNYHRERSRKFHEPYGNAADIWAWERKLWDILRKDPTGRGFYTLAEAVKRSMREVIPSDVILPEGAKSLLAAGPGNTDYYIFGDGARGNVELGADNIGTSVASGLRVHVVREVTIDRNGIRIAPLKRLRTIGDHFRLEDYLTDCRPEEYRSCSRTIKVFDMSESRGVFKPVDFLYALDHTERFDKDGDEGALLGRTHNELARNVASKALQANLTIKDGFADMFLYKNSGSQTGYSVVQVLGQMEKEALSWNVIVNTAETLVHRSVSGKDSVRAALASGVSLINKIYAKNLTQDDLTVMRDIISNSSADGIDNNGVITGNEYGAHDFPVSLPVGVAALPNNYLPPGYGSVAGMYTIANSGSDTAIGAAISKDTRDTAINFTEAVESLYNSTAPVFSDRHMAFSGDYVPVHFSSSYAEGSRAAKAVNSRTAFAQNLVDHSKAPLYYTGVVPGLPAGAAVSNLSEALVETETIEGAEDESVRAIIEALRATVANNATPQTRNAFANTDSIGRFLGDYENSPFAAAYARYTSQKATDAAERQDALQNKTFALFATSYLEGALERSSVAGGTSTLEIGNVVNGVVNAVNNTDSISPYAMESTLQNWARGSRSSSASAGVPGSDALLSRLVLSPTALAKANRNNDIDISGFALADPYDVTSTINLTDHNVVSNAEFASRSSLQMVFAHSTSSAITFNSAAKSGSKRSRDYSISRASPSSRFGLSGAVPGDALKGVLKGGKEVTATPILDQRWDRAVSLKDSILTAAIQLVLLTPATRSSFEKMYNANVRVPVSILGERPLRRYEAAACIFTAGGPELGEIAWSKYDVHLSSNANTKDFEGNASIWAVAIVRREERYFLAEDVMVTGYLGGESLKPFTAASFNPAHYDRNSESVFYFLVPSGSLRGSNAVQRVHDIRGFFNPDLIEQRLTEAARGLVVDKPHYPSALYYAQVYKFNHMRTLTIDDTDYYKVDGRIDNTITFQTMQYMWDPKTGKWSEAILNTGHFGENIYEGHGDLRTMDASEHYKEKNYSFAPFD